MLNAGVLVRLSDVWYAVQEEQGKKVHFVIPFGPYSADFVNLPFVLLRTIRTVSNLVSVGKSFRTTHSADTVKNSFKSSIVSSWLAGNHIRQGDLRFDSYSKSIPLRFHRSAGYHCFTFSDILRRSLSGDFIVLLVFRCFIFIFVSETRINLSIWLLLQTAHDTSVKAKNNNLEETFLKLFSTSQDNYCLNEPL